MFAEEVMDLKYTTHAGKTEQIKQTASMFARVTRDAEEIAAALRVSFRTVQRLIYQSVFQGKVRRLGYQGELRFRKSTTCATISVCTTRSRTHREARVSESETTVARNDQYTGTPSCADHC